MTRKGEEPLDRSDVLNADQAAELLDVSVGVLRRMAAAGELPARKVGREWRFSRQGLSDWLAGGDRSE